MEQEAWETVTYDTISLKCGKYQYSFFHSQEIGESDENLKMVEPKVTRFVLTNFATQLCQLSKCDFRNSIIENNIIEPFTQRDLIPGDVDIIIYNKDNPGNTTAIEVKVLRKNKTNELNDYLIGFERIKKGVVQAEGLLGIGFGTVFLLVVVLANVSNQVEKNLATRSIDTKNWKKIRQRFDQLLGNLRIGLINIEINQNSEKQISERGSISGFTYKYFIHEQKYHITEKSINKIRLHKNAV